MTQTTNAYITGSAEIRSENRKKKTMTPEIMAAIMYKMSELLTEASDESDNEVKKEILDVIASALKITGHMTVCELPGEKYTRGEVLDMYKRMVSEYCDGPEEDPSCIIKEVGGTWLRDQYGRKSKQNTSVIRTRAHDSLRSNTEFPIPPSAGAVRKRNG